MTYFSLGSGIVALAIEVFVALSLMEMPPFGKDCSDIIWALPFFALIIFALATPGLLVALRATHQTTGAHKFMMAGLVLNALSLAIPVLLLVAAVGRLLVSTVA
ncbi:MAG: hypothetical protein ACJ8LL_00330 [Candidatus Udaeobacter sp.]